MKLKPCPFCGSEMQLVSTVYGNWRPSCKNTKCVMFAAASYKTRKEAIEACNRRVEDGN